MKFLPSLFFVFVIALNHSGWASTKLYIPEQERKTSPGMSERWLKWLKKDEPHKFICQDESSLSLKNGEVKMIETKPRFITLKYYSEEQWVDLTINNVMGSKKTLNFSNSQPDLDGSYSVFYEPLNLYLIKRESWGEMKFSRTSGNYTLFFQKWSKGVIHITGSCEYIS